MTLNQIVVGLTAWTMLSIVVGLAFGAIVGHFGAERDGAQVPVRSPLQ